jgi:hypothetical protein
MPPVRHPPGSGARPRPRALLALLACVAVTAPWAVPWAAPSVAAWLAPRAAAQDGSLSVRLQGPFRFIAAQDLALALGAPLVITPDTLTFRAHGGVLTVFAGAPDAIWQARGAAGPSEVAAFAPPLQVDGAWYLPEDLVQVLGVLLEGHEAVLPDGRRRSLALHAPPPQVGGATEVLELAPAVPALRLYATSPSGPHAVSLLAVDLGMLALAFPEQQAALDAQLRELVGEKALFLAVTSLGPSAWDPALYVQQDGVELLLSAPLDVQVLEGDPANVRPGAPVAAVAFLPAGFDLRRPITLRWAGVSGTLTLRR